MTHDVFISYSNHDKTVADALCATLESRKIRCWIAPRDIVPGIDYATALIESLSTSRLMVLVFSKESNKSPFVMREVERAVSKGIPIIPFRIENVLPSKAMEFYLSAPHWLDAMTPPLEKHLQKLADTIQTLLANKNKSSLSEASQEEDKTAANNLPQNQPESAYLLPITNIVASSPFAAQVSVTNIPISSSTISNSRKITEYTYAFATKWGSKGSGNCQFDGPKGIAVDGSGYIYVTDSRNKRIQKFTNNGVFVTKWGMPGFLQGQFLHPIGIKADDSGYVYVTDTNKHNIQKYTNGGVFVAEWGSSGSGDGQFGNPTGVDVDDLGNVYVIDSGNNRVQKFNGDGVLVAKWGSNGTGKGQFNNPYGIAVDGLGSVYVADTGNHRIQKFNSEGVFLAVLGNYGSEDGEFSYPTGIAVDQSGHIYISEQGNNRVQKIALTGVFVTKWGSSGSGDGGFSNPFSIAVDQSECVYVADSYNDRVQKFAIAKQQNKSNS